MKAYKYIFKKSMLSFLGALLIITAIDFSFNFFSEIEDINKQAGKTFRGILSQEARREFSTNLSALDIALKGNRGSERYKNFEKWLIFLLNLYQNAPKSRLRGGLGTSRGGFWKVLGGFWAVLGSKRPHG